MAVSTTEDFSTLGLTELDRKQVVELQEKNPYIRRVIATAGKCTNENGIFTNLTTSGIRFLNMDRKRNGTGGS